MSAPVLADWLAAAEKVLAELANSCLAFDGVERTGHRTELPRTLPGAYVPLVTPAGSLQVGIAAEIEQCRALARALLCMEPEEELAPADVADALGEIVNILAGGLKARMVESAPSISLGLPIFINGAIEPTDKLEFAISEMRIGPIPASLVLVQHKQGA